MKLIAAVGGSALKQVEQALRDTTDPEVRARLESLLPWLKIDASTAAFQRACSDQWFLLRNKGQIEGVEHHRAQLSGERQDRLWTLTADAWIREDDGTISTIHHRLVAKHDEFLTPLEGSLRENIGKYDWELNWRFHDSFIESQFIDHGNPSADSDSWRKIDLGEPLTGGILLAWNFETVLERNTIAGLGQFEGRVLVLKPTKSALEHLKFVRQEINRTDSHVWPQISTRWDFGEISNELQGTVVISPEIGLVHANMRSCPDIDRSDEETCRNSELMLDAAKIHERDRK
ncbi:MAG: hypothetical protein K8T20_04480 [Planctomycetes bacterium]|nr:hypothetical protein [Planctomycetota bacterium]